MESFSFIDLTSIYGRLKLCGEDKVDLLDRLSTNDISTLKELGQGISTVLTTNKGRIIDLLKVYFFTDHLMLISDIGSITKVSEWIDFYTIMEDVTQIDVSDETFQIRIFSDDVQRIFPRIDDCKTDNFFVDNLAEAKVTIVSNKMNQKKCLDLIGDLSDKKRIIEFLKNSGTQLELNQFENIRISLGHPKFGMELTEEFNPLEAGLIDHISFNKGCYIGQEVVARLNTYDKVQRKLVKLSWDGLLKENEIISEGKVVGVITSNLEGEGLGFVRNNFANLESDLTCGDRSLQVTEVLSD